MMDNIPSWAIAIDENDRLIFQYITIEEFMSFEVRVRQIISDGQIITSKYVFTPAATDTLYETTIILSPGHLVSVSIITDSVVVVHGSAFGRITLNRLEAGEPGPILELAAGYVFDRCAATWPTMQPAASAEGRGSDIIIASADPAAGANISYTVPDRVHMEINSVKLRLVTDATVANRQVVLRVNVGATIYFQYVCTTLQAASLTYDYVFAPFGATEILTGTTVMCPIPVLKIPPGFALSTLVTNLQAADNLTSAYMSSNRRYSI